jgi:ABC-2 type transport system ATP-binding protein
LKEDSHIEIKHTPPRFEDAFIDILGGGPGGWSGLAEKTPPVKATKEAVVEAKGLVKRFGSFTAADNLTFSIPSGEIFGLLGPNGAGKSTTFKMLCGLLKPTAGEAFVQGYNLQQAPSEARSHLGYMAQKFSLYGNLSVQQNLEFFSGIYNLKGMHRREMIQEMIEIFALKPYLNESAETLPLGFKQRLALSCSLMHHPEVLFLDEPTSGVDPITRREFWNHINGLVEKGVTVLVTTHFMDEAEYCDRIALVYRSKLITIGTPDELKEQAKTKQNRSPTLEDAFITLVQRYDEEHHAHLK